MKIRRPFRAVVYLAIIVAAVGYVVISAARQPAFTNGTFVGATFARLTGRSERTHPNFGTPVFVVPFAGGWLVLDDYTQGTEDLGNMVVVRFLSKTFRYGIWHQVVESHHDLVQMDYQEDDTKRLDAKSRMSILAVIALTYPALAPESKLTEYAAGGSSTRRILWLGVLADLSILAAFAAIIFSLVKLRREIRWRKPGHCTVCDYDLAGLTADKCPECGAAVTPSKGI